MSQTERIFFIDRQIRRHGYVRSSDIADEFQVCDRQVKRDIEYLRDRLGAPLEYDRTRRGYVYTGRFEEFQNADERMLVFNAVFRGLARTQGLMPMMSDMVQKHLDLGISREYRSLLDKIVFSAPVIDLPDYKVFGAFCTAMERNRRLTMEYRNAKGVVSCREIEPLRLVSYSGRWYVVAWDLLHDGLRNFHLSRVLSIRLTDTPMERRCSDDALSQYINSGFGISMGGAATEVTIRIVGEVVHTVRTQIWHQDQRMSPISLNADGKPEMTISLPVTNLAEILGKVLSFGSSAVPVAPPEFVEQWRSQVAAMSRLAVPISADS